MMSKVAYFVFIVEEKDALSGPMALCLQGLDAYLIKVHA